MNKSLIPAIMTLALWAAFEYVVVPLGLAAYILFMLSTATIFQKVVVSALAGRIFVEILVRLVAGVWYGTKYSKKE